MPQFQAICVEMFPKKIQSAIIQDPKNLGNTKAIFQKDAVWKPKQVGNITITFGSSPNCSGCSADAAWSLVGSESNSGDPISMNLGFIDPPFESFTFNNKTYDYSEFKDDTRNWCSDQKTDCTTGYTPGCTVIHEFCHSLGMLHEHQNNLFKSNNIQLNKPAIIEYYNSIGLGEEGANANMLTIYDCESNPDACNYVGSTLDLDSIMLYALPDEFVVGPNPTKPNFVLSKTDKEWLAKMYPMTSSDNMPFLTVRFTDTNEPEWKTAFTTKNVIEKLAPIIGVKYRFIWNNGTTIDYNPIQKISTITQTPSTTMQSTFIMKNKKLALKNAQESQKQQSESQIPDSLKSVKATDKVVEVGGIQINNIEEVPLNSNNAAVQETSKYKSFEPEKEKPIIEVETFDNLYEPKNIIFILFIILLFFVSIRLMTFDKKIF